MQRELAPLFSTLLSYPDGDSGEAAGLELAELVPQAAESLARFRREAAELGAVKLQEAYDATFDLNPRCIPYLSVHAFGEESFKRANLMTALARRYETEGFDAAGELPDHLAVMLRFAPHLDAEEWDDLLEGFLRPAVKRMAASLAKSPSPYRHVLDALSRALLSNSTPEKAHA